MTLFTDLNGMTLAISSSLLPNQISGYLRKFFCAFLVSLLFAASLEGGFCNKAKRAIAEEAKQEANARTSIELRPDIEPLDLNALKPGNLPSSAISATTISPTGLTVPSLWWVQEQYAAQEQLGGKLIETWVAYPGEEAQPGRVDVIVNRQLWSLLDYLQRYTFISDFGATARDYGYNIRVFDNRANFLAAYTCDYRNFSASRFQRRELSQATSISTDATSPIYSPFVEPSIPLTCNTSLDHNGKSGLGGRSIQPGGGASSIPGIGQ